MLHNINEQKKVVSCKVVEAIKHYICAAECLFISPYLVKLFIEITSSYILSVDSGKTRLSRCIGVNITCLNEVLCFKQNPQLSPAHTLELKPDHPLSARHEHGKLYTAYGPVTQLTTARSDQRGMFP